MRNLVVLIPLIVLTGCGSQAPAAAPNTHGPVALVTNVPMTTPPPVKGKVKGGTSGPKALPTAQPYQPSPTPYPPSSFTSTLVGRVTDASTHRPIAGALLSVDSHHTVTTGPAGRFSIRIPSDVAVAVRITKKGYIGALTLGRVTTGQTATASFTLTRLVPGSPAAPPAPSLFGSH